MYIAQPETETFPSKINEENMEPQAIKRKRLIIKKGNQFVAIHLSDVISFYHDSKVIFALMKDGTKFIVEKTLAELEMELDSRDYFRINRQCIINGNFIKSFRPYKKIKILLEMDVSFKEYTLMVSQKRASRFRKWFYDF